MSEIQKLQMQLHRLSGGRFGPDPAYHSERTTTTGVAGLNQLIRTVSVVSISLVSPSKERLAAVILLNSIKPINQRAQHQAPRRRAVQRIGNLVSNLSQNLIQAGKQGKRASKIAKSKEGKKPPKEKNVIHGIKLGSKFKNTLKVMVPSLALSYHIVKRKSTLA